MFDREDHLATAVEPEPGDAQPLLWKPGFLIAILIIALIAIAFTAFFMELYGLLLGALWLENDFVLSHRWAIPVGVLITCGSGVVSLTSDTVPFGDNSPLWLLAKLASEASSVLCPGVRQPPGMWFPGQRPLVVCIPPELATSRENEKNIRNSSQIETYSHWEQRLNIMRNRAGYCKKGSRRS
jgi:hypothetical protein